MSELSHVLSGSFAIQDKEIINTIKHIDVLTSLWDDNITNEFINNYRDWILSSTLNNIIGLQNFSHIAYSNGTSQSFDMFYIKNKEKRFRCYKGEYVYHKIAWRNNWKNWKYLEDDELDKNDAVVISLPFSDTGSKHEHMDQLLLVCDELNIPVLVDCAYFGMCNNITFDFNHKCITDVVFSLSKTFPVAHARIGVRFNKHDDDDLLSVYNKMNYNNRLGAKIGTDLIRTYSSDFVYNKYKDKQDLCCKILDLEPSNCVIFGIDTHNNFSQFNRGTNTNRVGLHNLFVMDENLMKETLYANSNKQ
jgi:hypothetical protein